MGTVEPLGREALYRRCDPSGFGFETTAEITARGELFGQERAARSVEFGIGVDRAGFNLFVMGPPGSGRHTLVRDYLARSIGSEPTPSDWVYVNNFRAPHQPIAIEMPAGRGVQLRDDMQQLVEELRSAIPAVFESDEYRSRAGQIEAEFAERHERAFESLGNEAAKHQIGLLRTPAGFSFAPLKNGEVLSAEDYAKLPEGERQRIEKVIGELQEKLEGIIRNMVRWRKEQREKLKELNREMTLFAVGHHVDELKSRYAGFEKVLRFLDEVQQDVIANVEEFLRPREPAPGQPPEGAGFRRYQVNVLVDRSGASGRPVVCENHPTYQNLVGRVDHISQLGTLVTDFTLIKPGSLHRANGGYLLVDAHKLLAQPFAWEGLKRALATASLRIESIGEFYSLVSTVSLQPEPIPLDVKVVLFGERWIYYLLQAYDPDFADLFKVVADFEDRFERNAGNDQRFARLVAAIARDKKLAALDRYAVARVIEHSARLAGDARKLSANLRAVSDLLCEADYRARRAGRECITALDVEEAIEAARARADRVHQRLKEQILRGIVLIDTAGARTGQINGLSVFQLGDYAFAGPTRITATTRLGDGRVIDVQREVELGGAIHSKGVLILSAFLAARFSTNRPHSLAASLVFEQTYGLVDGDSASLAELCALLSSLADAPIRQSLAVTGSVNQLGEVQAIGGVNEKIEGFFDICKARGLDGQHGVIIPRANVDDLMLRSEVVEAAAAGRFHVYPVTTVDEAIELLTGVPAGAPDAAGNFPPGTINGRVAARMKQLSERAQAVAAAAARAREQARKR